MGWVVGIRPLAELPGMWALDKEDQGRAAYL